MVKAGDTIAKEQAVLELETDKATIEVPSSVAGVVKSVNAKVGDKVKVGQVILTVAGTGAGSGAPSRKPQPKAAAEGGQSQRRQRRSAAPRRQAEAEPPTSPGR